jgi:hypothetical protein
MTSRRTKVLFAIIAVAGLLLVGCAKKSKTNTPITGGLPEVTTTTTAAVNGASIPITMQSFSDGALGAIVQVSVGGGAAVPMILDTGSSGVMVLPSAIGPNATQTGQSISSTFAGGGVTAQIVNATVTVGTASTTGPIQVESITSGASNLLPGGLQGVFGIGPSEYGAAPTAPFTPLLQMGAPFDGGFTVSLPASASAKGALVIGPVSAPSTANSVPLTRNSPATYPNGAPSYAKDVNLCWTLVNVSGCGPTDLDTGMSVTTFAPTGSQASGTVNSGGAVTMALPNGGATLWSFTTGVTPSHNEVVFMAIPPPTLFNSGVAFYLGKNVGFDMVKGQVSIW